MSQMSDKLFNLSCLNKEWPWDVSEFDHLTCVSHAKLKFIGHLGHLGGLGHFTFDSFYF